MRPPTYPLNIVAPIREVGPTHGATYAYSCSGERV